MHKNEDFKRILGEEKRAVKEEQKVVEASHIIKKEIAPKYVLRSHMDIVRGLQFMPEIDVLASVSEDCTVKLWNLQNIE